MKNIQKAVTHVAKHYPKDFEDLLATQQAVRVARAAFLEVGHSWGEDHDRLYRELQKAELAASDAASYLGNALLSALEAVQGVRARPAREIAEPTPVAASSSARPSP